MPFSPFSTAFVFNRQILADKLFHGAAHYFVFGINFKDVVMQVYKDYVLYGSGTTDGEDFEAKTDIFIA